MAGAPVIPPPDVDDDDDVAWALQTAAIQWQRGGKADAVVWLRRAVDAAIAAGNSRRTKELTRLASDVAERVAREARGGPRADLEAEAPPDGAAARSVLPGQPSGEVAIEFDDVTDVSDDLEDDADTLPPPPRASTRPVGSAEDGDDLEQDVSGDDLLSVPPPSLEVEDGDFQELEEVTDVEQEAFVSAVLEPDEESVAELADGDVEVEASEVEASEVEASEVEASEVEASEVEASEVDPDEAVESADLLEGSGAAAPEGSEPLETLSAEDVASVVENAVPSGSGSGIAQADGEGPDAQASDAEEHTAPWSSGQPPSSEEPAPASAPTLDFVEEVPPNDEADRGVESIGSEPASTAPGAAAVDDILLEGVRGFEDLPEDMQRLIVGAAVLTTLSAEEEVGSFGAALVTRGKVGIMPAVADAASAVAAPGEIVFTQGTLEEKIPLRVVALEDGTVVASWTPSDLARAFADCPWVADELRQVADRFQALAGATLGALGERLDDTMRDMVFSRLTVRAYAPGEVIVESGKPVPGMHIVGSGRVELEGGGEAAPGDFLFSVEVLGGGKAKTSARAGKSGALVLVASRAVAHELLVSVPPLLEILAG